MSFHDNHDNIKYTKINNKETEDQTLLQKTEKCEKNIKEIPEFNDKFLVENLQTLLRKIANHPSRERYSAIAIMYADNNIFRFFFDEEHQLFNCLRKNHRTMIYHIKKSDNELRLETNKYLDEEYYERFNNLGLKLVKSSGKYILTIGRRIPNTIKNSDLFRDFSIFKTLHNNKIRWCSFIPIPDFYDFIYP